MFDPVRRRGAVEAAVHGVAPEESRAFLQRMPVDIAPAEAIVLEDLGKQATRLDKALAAIGAYLPVPLLERWLGITKIPAAMRLSAASSVTCSPNDILGMGELEVETMSSRHRGVVLGQSARSFDRARDDLGIRLTRRWQLHGALLP